MTFRHTSHKLAEGLTDRNKEKDRQTDRAKERITDRQKERAIETREREREETHTKEKDKGGKHSEREEK